WFCETDKRVTRFAIRMESASQAEFQSRVIRRQRKRRAIFGDRFGWQTGTEQRICERLAQRKIFRRKPNCFTQWTNVLRFTWHRKILPCSHPEAKQKVG